MYLLALHQRLLSLQELLVALSCCTARCKAPFVSSGSLRCEEG